MVYGQIVIDIRVLPDSQLDTVHTEGCAASGGLPLGSDLSKERRLRSLTDLIPALAGIFRGSASDSTGIARIAGSR